MRFGSVCSGIESASVAWEPLGWSPQWFAELAPFPSAVLAHRWPTVPNYGDFTKLGSDVSAVDLLVGGTPCQSFSVAGLRGGLADKRGNLALEYLRLADRLRPRWIVWENVPGVLSSGGGRDFGAFLGALGELGYGWAYRILDAQHFGIPQRRRRVFVVARVGGAWRSAAEVLFERAGLLGDYPASGEARESPPADAGASLGLRCGAQQSGGPDSISGTVTAKLAKGSGGPAGDECQNLVSVPFRKSKRAHSAGDDETWVRAEVGNTLNNFDSNYPNAVRATHAVVVAFDYTQNNNNTDAEMIPTLRSGGSGSNVGIFGQTAEVRRLTPRECERLQGFPGDHTLIPYRGKQAADGPRYHAIGNAMAVPCMRWIGERIAKVEARA